MLSCWRHARFWPNPADRSSIAARQVENPAVVRTGRYRPKADVARLKNQSVVGSIQSGRSPNANSLRILTSDSRSPIFTSIAPTHPQQSPPQSVESGSAGLPSARPHIWQYLGFSLFIMIKPVGGPRLAEAGRSAQHSRLPGWKSSDSRERPVPTRSGRTSIRLSGREVARQPCWPRLPQSELRNTNCSQIVMRHR